jgi:hypothetical protein
VKVIDMERSVGCDPKIGSEAAPLLTSGLSDVVVISMDKRKPAQCYISVCASLKPAVLADPVMKPHLASDETRLMILWVLSFKAEHFLEGDDVSIDLPEDLRDSPNLNPSIKTAPLMDVVGRNSYQVHWNSCGWMLAKRLFRIRSILLLSFLLKKPISSDEER